MAPTSAKQTAELKKDTSLKSRDSGTDLSSANNAITPSSSSSADSQKKASAKQSAPAVVYFGYDSYILTDESRNTLQASFKNLAGKQKIQIEGHCDERGSSEYNLALGEKRAKSAQSYLVALGYPADRISTISYGKERPADKGNDESAWAKNRRDELKVVK